MVNVQESTWIMKDKKVNLRWSMIIIALVMVREKEVVLLGCFFHWSYCRNVKSCYRQLSLIVHMEEEIIAIARCVTKSPIISRKL